MPLTPSGEARDFARRGVLAQHADGHAAHDFPARAALRALMAIFWSPDATASSTFLDEGADARLARFVDLGPPGDLGAPFSWRDFVLAVGLPSSVHPCPGRYRRDFGERPLISVARGGQFGDARFRAIPETHRESGRSRCPGYRFLNWAGRLSTKAAMPSFWSSVPNIEWTSRLELQALAQAWFHRRR